MNAENTNEAKRFDCDSLIKELCALADPAYKDFQCRLIPTVDRNKVLGVRTPVLRKFSADFVKRKEASEFLNALPHRFYEENNLHAFLIEKIGNFEETMAALEIFLPYIDNWATCDSLHPKCFLRHKKELLPILKRWLSSPHTYTVRFAIKEFMCDYLTEDFSPEYPLLILSADNGSYYLSMMTAWYFATALAFRYQEILPYLESNRLRPETHKRTIRKAIESYRISEEQKTFLKTLL